MKTMEGYSLSNHQKRIWKLQGVYEAPFYSFLSVKMNGILSIPRIKECLIECMNRYEILRTRFQEVEGMEYPLQIIDEKVPFSFSYSPSSNKEEDHNLSIQQIVSNRLDVGAGKNVHIEIRKLKDKEYEINLYGLSLCTDLASLKMIIHQAISLYVGNTQLPEEEIIQYVDFSQWQNDIYESEEVQIEIPRQAVLPYERLNEQSKNLSLQRIKKQIDQTLSSEIKNLGMRYNLSVSSLLLSGWKVFLSKLSCLDMPVGVVAEGREYEELKESVGQFEKVLPVQLDYNDYTYIEYAEKWQKHTKALFDKAEYVNPLTLMSKSEDFIPYQARYIDKIDWPEPFSVSIEDLATYSEKHKLFLTIFPAEEGYKMILQFNACNYRRDDAEKLLNEFIHHLKVCADSPEKKLKCLSFLTETEENFLQDQLNRTYSLDSVRERSSILELLEESFQAHSDLPALVVDSKTLSYRELNSKVNRLARYIKQYINPEDRVAIFLPRSEEAVISILAVLKAGGCFVPIDVKWPVNRVQYAIKNSGASLAITKEQAGLKDINLGIKVLDLEAERLKIQQEDEVPFVSSVLPEQLAYVLFTSGSTGMPKGVSVQHDSLLNYILWVDQQFKNEDLKLPFISELGFDAFLKQLFYPLMRGKKVTLFSEEDVLEPVRFLEKFLEYELNTLNLVPSLWNVLVGEILKDDILAEKVKTGITHLLVGGEKISSVLIKDTWELFPNIQVINLYGPTETTSNSTFSSIKNELFVPMGKPVRNTKVLVLNKEMERTAVGETGELYIGGTSVSRGYFENRSLTATQFLPDPFEHGKRLYKTGDLARLMVNGELEFVGRIDEQIKINGKRADLNEVEAVLRTHPSVKEAIVFPLVQEGTTILAFCTGNAEEEEIKEYLRKWLPVYMVPAKIIALAEFPLNNNGKTDRSSLLALYNRLEKGRYVSPKTELEQVITGIWKSVIKKEQVGIRDNFFELGGHSLNATQIISRIRKIYELDVPVSLLFESETVENLAKGIQELYPHEDKYIRLVSEAYLKAEKMASEEAKI